ncbi:response regulator [Sinosporangium siamense]|uniref:DNA-binding response regulator n=1 Tax=Sinosporangium siamense TaxID=1367973 RepID=A0A919V9P1_9ACTN|nr:response regulator transcription factor [Sinosporangium siamense]GII95628.1 DNA-binding response regulator [Sinosporangium siamense]
MAIRVLLVDDESLLRAGVKLILRHADDIEVVAEAGNGSEAVEMTRRHNIDVALMDIRMPGMDGLAAVAEMARVSPQVQVVMLTTFGEEDYVARALRAGAAGFLLKDTGPEELIQAVRTAAGGQSILSPRITRQIIDQYVMADDGRAAQASRRLTTLTERERDVLVKLGAGLSNVEISKELFLGESTVKAHVSRILTKLDCANRVQAAILAHDAGLLPGP